jgi:UDP-N-acetylglucosamine enolpyruvyl transferase
VLTVKGCFGKIKGFEYDFQEEPDHVDFYDTTATTMLTQNDVFLKCLPTTAIRSMIEFLVKTGIRCKIRNDEVMIHGTKSVYAPIDGFSKANDTT